MTAYTDIPNALVAVGAKPFATTLQGLRDNIAAGLEADPTAPVTAGNWHPFNKVTNGDANTGAIWTFAANGAVAAVTSPNFVDGWDYAFLLDRLQATGPGGFLINMWRETSGAYAGAAQTGAGISNSGGLSLWLEAMNVRRILNGHAIFGANTASSGSDSVAAGPVQDAIGIATIHATPQKILRVQFTNSSGNFTGSGAGIYMYRRRAV